MIRLTRDNQEPAALALERVKRLPAARAAIAAQAKVAFTGYQEAKPQLFKDQHGKCAYCEKRLEQASYYETEHYRPKDYYWWLAWTWENLFYGCSACNSQTHKGNKFPLKQGSPRLEEGASLPGDEQALLLDPAAADPLDHIRFAPDRAPDGWGPVPLTEEGQWTIALLGLHRRPGMRSHWKRCAGQMEGDPDLKAARGAKIRGDVEGVRAVWAGLVARWLHPESDFLALRWCVLDHHFEEPYRTLHGLPLPRPGKAPTRKRKVESDGLSASSGMNNPPR